VFIIEMMVVRSKLCRSEECGIRYLGVRGRWFSTKQSRVGGTNTGTGTAADEVFGLVIYVRRCAPLGNIRIFSGTEYQIGFR